MKRSVVACLSVLAVLAGCSSEPSIVVSEEPVGANCPTGGFRIESDGEVFYSCNESEGATTEEIARGAEGNPCLLDALKVTIPVTDGEPRVVYVCTEPEPDPAAMEFADVFLQQMELDQLETETECVCEDPDAPSFECTQSSVSLDFFALTIRSCMTKAFQVIGPVPAGVAELVECQRDKFAEVESCLNAIAPECTDTRQDEIYACSSEDTVCEPTGEDADEINAWGSSFSAAMRLFGCGLY